MDMDAGKREGQELAAVHPVFCGARSAHTRRLMLCMSFKWSYRSKCAVHILSTRAELHAINA